MWSSNGRNALNGRGNSQVCVAANRIAKREQISQHWVMGQSWKTVRVFIYSTFRDMHADREHLVAVVFPELRERVEQLGLEFFDVDLRFRLR